MTAFLSVPTSSGGRRRIKVDAGKTVQHELMANKAMDAAARWGLEKKVGHEWVRVHASYVLKEGDELRVAFPSQTSRAAEGMAELLAKFVKTIKRKPHASTGIRTRRK